MAFMKERLKQRRLDMGLTLQEVADIIGVEKPTVQRYESGVIKSIDTLTVEKLASAVKCNPTFLIGWSDEITQPSSCNILCTPKEKQLIRAYRNKPEMQKAVDTILGIETKEEYSADLTVTA